MKSPSIAELGILRKLGSLDWLTSAQLEKLTQKMVVKKLRKKETIFDQGQSAKMIYLVIAGTIRLSTVNQEDKRVVVTLVPPGDLFGVGFLFPTMGQPFDADHLATVPSEFLMRRPSRRSYWECMLKRIFVATR